MTMLIVFIKDYSDLTLGDYSAGATEYVPRPLGQKLCSNHFAQPHSVYLKEQRAKKETAELKVEPEKAVVEPVVEKPLPLIEDEKSEINQCEGVMASGEPCKANAKVGSKYCWRHEPKE